MRRYENKKSKSMRSLVIDEKLARVDEELQRCAASFFDQLLPVGTLKLLVALLEKKRKLMEQKIKEVES